MYKKYKTKNDFELNELASKNDSYAINELGERMFQNGDYEISLNYFKKAEEIGNSMGSNNIGFYYLEIKKDFLKAEEYFLKAVEKGNNIALNNMGVLKEQKGDFEQAKYYYKLSYKNGFIDAILNLAIMYVDVYDDKEKAEKYCRLAIEKGSKEAEHILYHLLNNE